MARRELTVRESRGPHNSLLYAFRDVSRWRVAWNWFWLGVAKKTPWFALKRFFLRRTGMKVGNHAAIALDAQFDVLFPNLIEIGEDAVIGYGVTILCHEYLDREYRTGPVKIGAHATIGANATILAGVTVAPKTVVSAMSLVNSDVEGFVGGVPAKPLATPPHE